MRPTLLLTALLAGALLTACSDGGGAARATDGSSPDAPAATHADGSVDLTDPGGTGGAAPAGMPTAVPAADGPVSTRIARTVMDRGDGPPEVCLGAVAESWPPQCGGPQLVGWDWAGLDGSERQGRVQWGLYLVTGTWDGTRLSVTEAVPGMQVTTEPLPDPLADPRQPSAAYSAEELERIASDLGGGPGRGLGGAQAAYAADGRVVVDVTFDDGSLQAWADEQYGAGVVVVSSALAPLGA